MTELEVYYQIITDLWKFFKKHYSEKERSDEDWAAVIRDMDERFEGYGGTPFAPYMTALVARTLEELQTIEKRGKTND